jgi:hypothetical protein
VIIFRFDLLKKQEGKSKKEKARRKSKKQEARSKREEGRRTLNGSILTCRRYL